MIMSPFRFRGGWHFCCCPLTFPGVGALLCCSRHSWLGHLAVRVTPPLVLLGWRPWVQASEVPDPQRSISTPRGAAILKRFGVPEFVARTLSQPRGKPPTPAVKRRTWSMGASKRQRLTAGSACEVTEHQPRARRIMKSTPLTSCHRPAPLIPEMNTPPSRSTPPAAPSYFD